MSTFQRCARYSPDKSLFICETQEQADALEARGWTALPEYPPEQAVWIQHWGQVPVEEPGFDRREPDVPAEVKKRKHK